MINENGTVSKATDFERAFVETAFTQNEILDTTVAEMLGSQYPGDCAFLGGELTRYEQIAQHVSRSRIANWLAVDNDNVGWPETQGHRLVLTDDWSGLGEAAEQQRLRQLLRNMDLS